MGPRIVRCFVTAVPLAQTMVHEGDHWECPDFEFSTPKRFLSFVEEAT